MYFILFIKYILYVLVLVIIFQFNKLVDIKKNFVVDIEKYIFCKDMNFFVIGICIFFFNVFILDFRKFIFFYLKEVYLGN